MRLYLFLITLTWGLNFGFAFGQNVDFTEANFSSDPNGFKQATKAIETGDRYFNSPFGRYDEAYEQYLIAWQVNPENAELNMKMGQCLIYLGRYFESQEYLSRSYNLSDLDNGFIHFLLGQSHQLTKDYQKAIDHYLNYRSYSRIMDKRQLADIDKRIAHCKNAQLAESNPVQIRLKNVEDAINGSGNDLHPTLNTEGNRMYFTAEKKSVLHKKKDKASGRFGRDIFISDYDHGEWKLSKPLKAPINGKTNDEVLSIAVDETKMLLSRGDGDIYEAIQVNGKWEKPRKLPPPVNSKHDENSASYNHDGTGIYFSSNRPNGFGKYDLYYVEKKKSKYKNLTNLGKHINSPDDEMGVFCHQSGNALYYSSDKKKGYGGYDLYSVVKDSISNDWQQPQHLDYPVNSPEDEVRLTMDYNAKKVCFSKLSEDGYGLQDIFSLHGPQDLFIKDWRSYQLVRGKALNEDGTPLHAFIKLGFLGGKSHFGYYETNPADGSFIALLEKNKPMSVYAHAKGYFPLFDLMEIQTDEEKIFTLYPIKKGKNFIIPESILAASTGELNNTGNFVVEGITEMLEEHPTMSINLGVSSANPTSETNELLEKTLASRMAAKGIDQKKFAMTFVHEDEAENVSVQIEELNLKAEAFATHPSVKAMKRAEAEIKKDRQAQPGNIPEKFIPSDKDGDGFISSKETLGAIDEFFDGTLQLTAEELVELIDYFFEQ